MLRNKQFPTAFKELYWSRDIRKTIAHILYVFYEVLIKNKRGLRVAREYWMLQYCIDLQSNLINEFKECDETV